MNHITEQDWMMYAMGEPEAVLDGRIRAHLEACAECAAMGARFTAHPQLLGNDGMRLRSALEVSDAEIEQMLAVAMEKIGGRPRHTVGFAEGIAILRTALEPVVGVAITRDAVEKALKEGGAEGTWREFVARLSTAIQSVSGASAGHLAGRAGMAIEV